MRVVFALALVAIVVAAKDVAFKAGVKGGMTTGGVAWSYDCDKTPSTCPDVWEQIGEDNSCASYVRQSPINFDHFASYASAGDYNDISLTAQYNSFIVSQPLVWNNGGSINVDYPGPPKDTKYGDLNVNYAGQQIPYKLQSFNLHSPSEHTINGKNLPLEMHMVHRKIDIVDGGEKFVVLSILFAEGPYNDLFKQFFESLPEPPTHGEPKNFKKQFASTASIQLDRLIHHTNLNSFWHYLGSSTTPPCAENVEWFVLTDPVTLSADQIGALKAVLPQGFNNRPVQTEHSTSKVTVSHGV